MRLRVGSHEECVHMQADFSRPAFVAAAFVLVARKAKVKIDVKQVLEQLAVEKADYDSICTSFIVRYFVCVCPCEQLVSVHKCVHVFLYMCAPCPRAVRSNWTLRHLKTGRCRCCTHEPLSIALVPTQCVSLLRLLRGCCGCSQMSTFSLYSPSSVKCRNMRVWPLVAAGSRVTPCGAVCRTCATTRWA